MSPPPSCPLCGGAGHTLLRNVVSIYSSRPFDVAACTACDHRFTDPLPSQDELTQIYGEQYNYQAHALIQAEKVKRARRYARHIAALPGVRRVLEVGCMHGLLLRELGKLGVQAKGIELGEEPARHCQAEGLDVVNTSLEAFSGSSDERFDAIVMSHLLEHIVQPVEQLERVGRLLRPGGQIVLIVPNASALTRKLFGRYWGYWQVPVHVHHFSEASLTKLLEANRFQVSQVECFGADSLFFLSSMANMLGKKSESNTLSTAQRWIIRTASVVLGPWAAIGNEDLVMVAQRRS